MRYKILNLIFLFFVYGCSFVAKVPVMKEKGNSQWQKKGTGYKYYTFYYSTPAYDFNKDSLKILIFPCPKPGIMVLFGPPFVPLIPNFYALLFPPHKPNKQFFVDLRFTNQSTKAISLNLSDIKFQNKNDKLNPSKVSLINHPSFGDVSNSNLQQNVIENFPENSYHILNSFDSVTVRYEFNKWTTDVRYLIVRFDNDADNTWLPILEMKTKNVFVYRPLYDQ